MASYEQNSTNRQWSVRFRVVEFGKVKNKRLSGYKTKKEAEQGYRDYLDSNMVISKKSNNHDITFAQLYKKYQEYSNTKLKVSSIYDRDGIFNNQLLPVFQDMKIFEISKKDILTWQTNITKQGYSYEYKSKLRRNLGSLFKFATMYYDLPNNPVYQVEPFRRTESKKEMPIWSIDNFRDFISTFEDTDLYRVFFTLLYLTGCHKGEAMALIWQDIDFVKKTIRINKNLTRKVQNKTYEIVSTKTNEIRTILIPDVLVDILKTHKQLSKNHKSTDFVFGGDYPIANTTTTKAFRNHIKLADVPEIHIHCLRHSHVSLLINNGENIVTIAKRLGHSSVEQTLNTYAHLMPDTEQEMVQKLNIQL